MLARGGRAVAAVFLMWFLGLALAGLGILPASDLPLGRSLAQAPAPLTSAVSASQVARSRASSPATAATASRQHPLELGQNGAGQTTRASRPAAGSRQAGTHGAVGKDRHRTRSSPASSTTGAAAPGGTPGTTHGNSAAPGQVRKSSSPGHLKSSSSPGHTKATTTSTAATTTTTATTPARGQSGSAPGQTITHRHGNAANG